MDAAFLIDAARSSLGAIVLLFPTVTDTLNEMRAFLAQAKAAASLDADFADVFAAANSFYTITKARPTMLRNPRIKGEGHHSEHSTMATTVAKAEVVVDATACIDEFKKRSVGVDLDIVGTVKAIERATKAPVGDA